MALWRKRYGKQTRPPGPTGRPLQRSRQSAGAWDVEDVLKWLKKIPAK